MSDDSTNNNCSRWWGESHRWTKWSEIKLGTQKNYLFKTEGSLAYQERHCIDCNLMEYKEAKWLTD